MHKLTHWATALVVALSLLTVGGRAHADDERDDDDGVEARPSPIVGHVLPYQLELAAGAAIDPDEGILFVGSIRIARKFLLAHQNRYGVWLSPTVGYQFGVLARDWSYHLGALGLTLHVGNRWATFSASALATGGAALWWRHPDKVNVFGATYGVGGQFFDEVVGLRVEHELLYFPDPLPGRHRIAHEAGLDQQIAIYGTVNVIGLVGLITRPPR